MKNLNSILSLAKETILLKSNAIANLTKLIGSNFENAVNFIKNAKYPMFATCIKEVTPVFIKNSDAFNTKGTAETFMSAVNTMAIATRRNHPFTQIEASNTNQEHVGVVHLHNLIKEETF